MNRFFTQIYQSCSDFSFYRTIVTQRLQATFQYFLLLLCAVGLLISFFYYFYLKTTLDYVGQWSQKNLPEMIIQKGILSSKIPQPYIVPDEHFVFILDTTGEVTRFDPQYSRGVLFMKDRVRIKAEGVETQDMEFKMIDHLVLSAQTVASWRKKITPLVIPLAFVLLFLAMAISKSLQAFFIALIASLFFPENRSGLNLKALFNLSIYAATPAILIGFIVQALKLNIPFFGLIYFAMYAAFFIGAFKQCQTKKQEDAYRE